MVAVNESHYLKYSNSRLKSRYMGHGPSHFENASRLESACEREISP